MAKRDPRESWTKKCRSSVVEKGVEAGVTKRFCSFSGVKRVSKLAPVLNMKFFRGANLEFRNCYFPVYFPFQEDTATAT